MEKPRATYGRWALRRISLQSSCQMGGKPTVATNATSSATFRPLIRRRDDELPANRNHHGFPCADAALLAGGRFCRATSDLRRDLPKICAGRYTQPELPACEGRKSPRHGQAAPRHRTPESNSYVDYGLTDLTLGAFKPSIFSIASWAPSVNPRMIALSAGIDLAIIIDGKTTPNVSV